MVLEKRLLHRLIEMMIRRNSIIVKMRGRHLKYMMRTKANLRSSLLRMRGRHL